MPRTKHKKLAEVGSFANVFENPFENKGKWREKVFQNRQPLVLELACGAGYYTVSLAEQFPDLNFIGVDKKGDRLWKASKAATERNLTNAVFLRILIEKIDQFFAPSEVDEIWITFPDPQPKPSKANKRLTSPRFLDQYKKILKPGGTLHLKTDNQKLFEYSLDSIAESNGEILEKLTDLHNIQDLSDILKIKTFYEEKFAALGEKISYVKWRFS